MKIKESKRGDIVILEISGSVDTRTSHEFEQKVLDLLEKGTRLLVINLEQVEHLASSGLRVLLMLAKKLVSVEGNLVLCSMNEHVETVLDISGLKDFFGIAPSAKEAVAKLHSTPKMSTLSSLAGKLLGVDSGKSGKEGKTSKLSSQVFQILAGSQTGASSSASPTKSRISKPVKSGQNRSGKGAANRSKRKPPK